MWGGVRRGDNPIQGEADTRKLEARVSLDNVAGRNDDDPARRVRVYYHEESEGARQALGNGSV